MTLRQGNPLGSSNNSGITLDDSSSYARDARAPWSQNGMSYEEVKFDQIKLEIQKSNNANAVIKIQPIFNEKELSNLNTNFLTYNLSSEYNFYTDYYENIIKNKSSQIEAGLPNLYVFADQLNEQKQLYKNLTSYYGEISLKPQRSNSSAYEYFDKVGKLFKLSQTNTNLAQKIENVLQNQSKIYFTKEGTNRLREINENKYLSPFFNTVKFFTHKQSGIADILDASDFTDQFCKTVIELEKNSLIKNLTLVTDSFQNGNLIQLQTTETCSAMSFNSEQEILNTLSSFLNSSSIDNVTSLGNSGNKASIFQKVLNFNIAAARMIQFFNSKKRNPQEFISNDPATSEVLMYEIVKFPLEFTATKNLPVQQSIYFPNLTNIEAIEFNDSQVKFGKVYDYTLNGYFFTLQQEINTNLLLSNFNRIAITENLTQQQLQELELINILELFIKNGLDPFVYSFLIFKKDLFKDRILAYDHPPTWPEIEIDGLIGIDNKLLIRLNSSISEIKEVPVLIQPEDQLVFLKNMILQKNLNFRTTDINFNEKIIFDGDDRIEHFQIFKLDFHPTSYADFKDNFVTASTTFVESGMENSFGFENSSKTNHSSYVDTVKPNNKYYYMFRSVDIHGNISNPSPVYEVEIINSDGTIYPIIKIVDILKKDEKTPIKDMRRFLYITPNTLQGLINERESGYFEEDGTPKQSADLVVNDVKLGISDNKMWNKKYRLKIRSKRTGKLVEVDFKFIYKAIQSNN